MEETTKPQDNSNGDEKSITNSGSIVAQGGNVKIDSAEESAISHEQKDSVKQVSDPNVAGTNASTDLSEENAADLTTKHGDAVSPGIVHLAKVTGTPKEAVEDIVGCTSLEINKLLPPEPLISNSAQHSKMDSTKDAAIDAPVDAPLIFCSKEKPEMDSSKITIADDASNSMEVEEPSPASFVVPRSIQDQVAEQQLLESEAVQKINNTSLSLLCQYSGSSDSESEDSKASKTAQSNKLNVSSSDSLESDDDLAELQEKAPLPRNYRECNDSILVSDAETMDTNAISSEDEGEDHTSKIPIRSKGEILVDELPHIEELTITVPETECKPIGLIDSIVAQIVLVQSVPGVELLNLDTILFLERGKRPLGKIFDVIGQVNRPIYCVLFNSNQEIVGKNITVGMEVFCAPRTEHTSFIILSELMRFKGSDASWMDDNEPPPHLIEYSDDEVEQSAKRKNRKKKFSANGESSTENTQQPQQHRYQQRHQYQQYQYPYIPIPQFRQPPANSRRNFNPRHSWHHNFNNQRYNHPQQYQQQGQVQQMLNTEGVPGAAFLPNPFAVFGPQPPTPPS